jgi:hypothetical protein
MKKLLTLAAVAEVTTGLALLVAPALVGRLLLGAEPAGVSIPVARVAGIALTALGIACLPGLAFLGMLTYSALVTAYLAYIGIGAEWAGPLLWPAVVVHAGLTLLLARAWIMSRRISTSGSP